MFPYSFIFLLYSDNYRYILQTQINMYAKHLIQVGKLVYLIGTFKDTAVLKKILQSNEGKSKIYVKCVEEIPKNMLKKIKYPGAKEGIIRSDWLNKMVDRYPQMVIFMFNSGQDTLQIQKIQNCLKEMLKKVNIFYADCLKANKKQDIIIRIIVTLTKQQFSSALIQQKVLYYLKTYQKDLFIIQAQFAGKQIGKYRSTWLSYLQKNYERKMKKIIKKYEQSNIIEKRINYSFKIAILSQILNKDEKKYYEMLLYAIRLKFSQITKKQFNFLKYLQIKQIRNIADTAIIRFIKFKIQTNFKELPRIIIEHINFFKMRSMEPSSCHFFFYYEELLWRIDLIQHILEVFYQTEIMEYIPKVFIAQLLNGLLSYLHKVSTINLSILKDNPGQKIEYLQQIYIGKINYTDITDAEMIITGIMHIIQHKNDYIDKGKQLINHYTSNNIFKENQKNFLNIFLIRFLLAQSNGRINQKISVYNDIIKLQMNRSNYFLMNELFNQIKQDIKSIDNSSKALLYGVASLICDFFQNQEELSNYLHEFFKYLTFEKQTPLLTDFFQEQTQSLFRNQPSVGQYHAFKLKRSSLIFMARVQIHDQIILSQDVYKVNVKIVVHDIIRQKMKEQNSKIRLHFNHPNMICLLNIPQSQIDKQVLEMLFLVEPLQFLRNDAVLKIEQVHLVLQKNNVAFVLDKNQIVFEKYDSTLLYSKIEEPEILISSQKKVYYINQTAYFHIIVKGIQGCKVTSKFSVNQVENGNTQFFMNFKERNDLTNTKITQELVISNDFQEKNVCWIKCNKIGNRSLKLQFTSSVQKIIQVRWRQKPLHLKSTYVTTKQINFNISNLFTITKYFREAPTGNLFDNNIPLNKKTLLSFYIKTADNILIKQLGHHNNPSTAKIQYFKNVKMSNTQLHVGENLKVSVVFQLTDECYNQIQLFLTTLFIKWRRIDQPIPIDNVYLDNQTLINTINDKVLITFQQGSQINKRQKASLSIKIQNLTKECLNACISMESTQYLLRIGEKSKIRKIQGLQTCEITFDIMCIHAGIFEFPNVKVLLNEVETKTSTKNILVYCS